MTYGLEVVDEVAAEALKLFGELLAAGEVITPAPWRGSVPWDRASRDTYAAQHPGAPLPAFQDGLARPEQLLPGTDGAADQTTAWPTWYILGGRGSGKTRPASEALAEWITAEPGDYAVMAPTFGDARDTCVEGPSGLIRALGGTSSVNLGPYIRKWNRSEGKLFHQNGSVVICDGADDGGFRVQGKNLTGAWCVAAGALVTTRRGMVPIEGVIVGDEVWTQVGWRRVRATAHTGRKPVVLVTTTTGSLRLTAEHKVWTAGGWVEAAHLTYGATVSAWSSFTAPQPGSSGRGFGGIGVLRAVITATGLAGCFMSPSGRARMGRSPITSSSTTKTRTPPIMPWPTSSRWTALPTFVYMGSLAARIHRLSVAASHWLNGRLGRSANLTRCPARAAAPSSSPPASGPNFIHAPAPLSSTVVTVEPDGIAEVYDLAVEGAPEFVANGLLVHNCDEVGLWRRRANKAGGDQGREPWYLAWVESLGFAVRIGRARIIATGTPKQGHPLVKMLLNDPMVVKSHLKTTDNAANLSAVALARYLDLFGGTRIGRQELEGEYLEDVAGALWTLAQIEADRITQEEFDLLGLTVVRVVIGVDPSGGVTETGIVKMALASDGHGYVFEDATAPGSPDVWGKAVVACFDREPNGDRVIPEMNQGGAMVIHVLRTVDENIPIKPVNAKVGKAARAEPISALCEQHKIHHVGTFPKLEDELCLAAGSLVTALRGDIPIEDIQAGELVLTRAGWAPVAWAGQTGVADLTSVTHASGDIYLTACHPVFVMELGRFVSARNVRPGQHLRGAPSRADMVSRLRGAGGGTAGCDAATSGIPKAGCSIGSPGRRTTAPQVIGGAGTSTTSTMIQGTTGWATWPGSPSRLMSPSMSPVGLRAMTLDVVIGRESSGRSGMGMTPSVRSVAPGIGLRRCVQLPAPLSAVESVRTDVSGRHGVPVFNLKVEVGYLPEFYAGGVLVHNCQWVPDSGAASPNRLDAYVWAATDLFIRRRQQTHEAVPIQITRQSTWKMGG